jgi:hypothetical protein
LATLAVEGAVYTIADARLRRPSTGMLTARGWTLAQMREWIARRPNPALTRRLSGTGHWPPLRVPGLERLDAEQLDVKEPARLRQQALTWLRADLDRWTQRVEQGQPKERQFARKVLEHWQRETDLAPVREAESLNKLAAEERDAWRRSWGDMQALRMRAERDK